MLFLDSGGFSVRGDVCAEEPSDESPDFRHVTGWDTDAERKSSPCLVRGTRLRIVHSLRVRRRRMDDVVQQFRQQAGREIGDRQGAERRYSDGLRLRQQGVTYWQSRAGDGVRRVARALGIAPVSLRRWAQDPRFRPVEMVADAPSAGTGLVVVVDATSLRVEGLDVETAAQLVARLR